MGAGARTRASAACSTRLRRARRWPSAWKNAPKSPAHRHEALHLPAGRDLAVTATPALLEQLEPYSLPPHRAPSSTAPCVLHLVHEFEDVAEQLELGPLLDASPRRQAVRETPPSSTPGLCRSAPGTGHRRQAGQRQAIERTRADSLACRPDRLFEF